MLPLGRREQGLLLLSQWRGWGCERRGVLIAHLQLPRDAHRNREGLGIVNLHIVAERWKEANGEQLDTLCLVQAARLR